MTTEATSPTITAVVLCGQQHECPHGPALHTNLRQVGDKRIILGSWPAHVPLWLYLLVRGVAAGGHEISFVWVGPDGVTAAHARSFDCDGNRLELDVFIPIEEARRPGWYRLDIGLDGELLAQPAIELVAMPDDRTGHTAGNGFGSSPTPGG